MTTKTYFNTTNGPVPIDDEGRIIGGQEWMACDSTEKNVRLAVKNGWIVAVAEPEEIKRTSPAADAFKEVKEAKAADENTDKKAK